MPSAPHEVITNAITVYARLSTSKKPEDVAECIKLARIVASTTPQLVAVAESKANDMIGQLSKALAPADEQ